MIVTPEKSKNVPKLRFPEFEGEWQRHELGDIGPVSMCKRIYKDETSSSGDVPFYKIGTFGREPDAFITQEKFDEFRRKYSFPNKGDILISAAGTIGRTVVYDGEPSYFQDSNIVWIANDETKVLNTFLNQSYENIRWLTEDTTIARLYNSNIKEKLLFLPNVKEQEKIAAFLGTVDSKIKQLTRKKDLLEQYKKGCMQKIFSQETRFKQDDGSDFPDWEMKRLEKICDMKAGEFVKATDIQPSRTEDLFPCFGANGLRGYTKTKTHQGIYPLIGRQGALCGNVMFATGEFHATEHAIVTAAKNQNYPKWLFYLLDQMHLSRYATGQAQPGLSIGTIERLKVNLPHPDEQKKIADFLSAIDAKIDLVASELDHATAFKKGLLQQMFV